MPSKTWTYNAITKNAEENICRIMALAAEGDDFQLELSQRWAYGVYCGWSSLTSGWQEIGDRERLEALTERKVPGDKRAESDKTA